jgi:hypothetical protein
MTDQRLLNGVTVATTISILLSTTTCIVSPNLHTMNQSTAVGTALAISYTVCIYIFDDLTGFWDIVRLTPSYGREFGDFYRRL